MPIGRKRRIMYVNGGIEDQYAERETERGTVIEVRKVMRAYLSRRGPFRV